ncbi:MAG: fluoride efflux transporter FluC [Geodermatophilaceae bacterium]
MRRQSTDGLPFDPDLADSELAADRPTAAIGRTPGGLAGHRWGILAAVSAGGALGGTARYGLERAFPVAGSGFPWATFAVNVAGAFVLSIVLVLIVALGPQRRYLRPFVAIGILGSFTTFSTWMLEVHDLATADRVGLASAYLGSSLLAGLLAAAAGVLVGRAAVRIRTARTGRSGRPAPS